MWCNWKYKFNGWYSIWCSNFNGTNSSTIYGTLLIDDTSSVTNLSTIYNNTYYGITIFSTIRSGTAIFNTIYTRMQVTVIVHKKKTNNLIIITVTVNSFSLLTIHSG